MLKTALTAACLSLAFAGAAQAAGEANGAWNCTLDGKDVGALGLDGNNYIFANPNGQSGRGGIMYQTGADTPSFVVLDGALVSQVGALGGWLDASVPETPELRIIDAVGNMVLCEIRKS